MMLVTGLDYVLKMGLTVCSDGLECGGREREEPWTAPRFGFGAGLNVDAIY